MERGPNQGAGPLCEHDVSEPQRVRVATPLGAFLRRCIPLQVSFLAGGLRLGSCASKGGGGDREYQAEGENR